MNLATRSYKKELLDDDNIPFADIRQNMQELNFINTWLGGHVITIAGLKHFAFGKKEMVVCEIGCGGGDNLEALNAWGKKHQLNLTFYGIDIKEACIDFAKTKTSLQHNTTWMVCDYRDAVFTQKPDVIFSSLFCHHFTEPQLVEQLQWMARHATLGFFINDLQRHWLAYSSIRMLTRLFSSSYLVKNDAPLSVARGFTAHEWQALLAQAKLTQASIQWKWAFRYLIVYKND